MYIQSFHMLALHVANVPSPEGAAAFFARAESARLAFGGVAAADAELQTLDDDLRQTEARMRLVPAVAERLPANADSDSLAEAVRQVLESCREADAARELRIKAEAALQNSQSELNRARTRQAEASAELRQAQERLNEARSQWTACLHEDQESQERRSASISEELTGIQEQEENLVKRVAELRSKVDALSRTDELSQLLQQEAALVEDMQRRG